MKDVPLIDIRTDGGTQTRASLDADTIEAYAVAMQEGSEFPPAVVFYDGTDYWLADGFHRVRARERRGLKNIKCDVRQGTQRDAILYSVGANGSHGLRRTNADKRRAVEAMLTNDLVRLSDNGSPWVDREIARRCAVSPPFVATIREEIPSVNGLQIARAFSRGGTVSTMNTANIGKAKATETREEETARLVSQAQADNETDPLMIAHRAKKAHAEAAAQKADTSNPDEKDLPVLARADIKHTDSLEPRTVMVALSSDPTISAATIRGRFNAEYVDRLGKALRRDTSGERLTA